MRSRLLVLVSAVLALCSLVATAQAGFPAEPAEMRIQIHIETAERWVVRLPERALGERGTQRPSLIRSEGLSRSIVTPSVDRRENKRIIRALIDGMGAERLYAFPPSQQTHRFTIDVTGQTDLVRLIPQGLIEAREHAPVEGARRFVVIVPQGSATDAIRMPTLLISSIANDQQRGDLLDQMTILARNPAFDSWLRTLPASARAETGGALAEFAALRSRLAVTIGDRNATRPLHQPLRQPDSALASEQLNPLETMLLFHRLLEARGIATDRIFASLRRPFETPDEALAAFDSLVLRDRSSGRYYWLAGDRLAESGQLPPEFAGRLALLIGQDKAQRTFIEIGRPSTHRIEVSAEMQVLRDGSVEGQSLTLAHGASAPLLALLAERLNDMPARAGAELLSRQMLDGVIRLGHVDRQAEQVGVHLGFRLEPAIEAGDVLLVPGSSGPRLHRLPLADFLPGLRRDVPEAIACKPLHLRQRIVLHLPDRRALLELPQDVLVKVARGHYQSAYRQEGRRLMIDRLLELDLPSSLCGRELVLDLAPVLRAAGRDMDRLLQIRRLDD